MKNIETTADRIKIFENTIRLSADFLIVLADTIRKMTNRLIQKISKLIAWYNKLAILKNSIDKKKDRNYLFEIRRERGIFLNSPTRRTRRTSRMKKAAALPLLNYFVKPNCRANSHITMPAVTLTLSECLVPNCGISIQASEASTTCCWTPFTSLPITKA